MAPTRIPLFPLEVVLFPGMPLPLHIFEPRYKQMIRECIAAHSEFGVVLAREGGIAHVGCTAEVVKVLKSYPDGRMDILTVGQTVFRIAEVVEEKAYLEVDVEFLEDQAGAPDPKEQKRLLDLYERCHSFIQGRAPATPDAASTAAPAYFVAHEMPFDLDFKQKLLEMRSEADRVNSLIQGMEALLPRLEKLQTLRKKVGGNGHRRSGKLDPSA